MKFHSFGRLKITDHITGLHNVYNTHAYVCIRPSKKSLKIYFYVDVPVAY